MTAGPAACPEKRSAGGADDIGGLLDLPGERFGAGQAEDVVAPIILAPRHCLRPGIMPVDAERDARRRPTYADAPNQPAQMGEHLEADHIAQMRCILESRQDRLGK